MSIADMQQIQLEKWVTSKDIKGNNTESVTNTYNVWAEVTRSSGQRSSINGKEGLTNFFIFRMWLNESLDVSGNWRVNYDNRKFTVQSIENEEEKNFYWIIKAESTGKR